MYMFSWKDTKKRAVEIEVRRAMTVAKLGVDTVGTKSDLSIIHPEWIRSAEQKNYSDLKLKVTEMIEKKQKKAMERRAKLAGKS